MSPTAQAMAEEATYVPGSDSEVDEAQLRSPRSSSSPPRPAPKRAVASKLVDLTGSPVPKMQRLRRAVPPAWKVSELFEEEPYDIDQSVADDGDRAWHKYPLVFGPSVSPVVPEVTDNGNHFARVEEAPADAHPIKKKGSVAVPSFDHEQLQENMRGVQKIYGNKVAAAAGPHESKTKWRQNEIDAAISAFNELPKPGAVSVDYEAVAAVLPGRSVGAVKHQCMKTKPLYTACQFALERARLNSEKAAAAKRAAADNAKLARAKQAAEAHAANQAIPQAATNGAGGSTRSPSRDMELVDGPRVAAYARQARVVSANVQFYAQCFKCGACGGKLIVKATDAAKVQSWSEDYHFQHFLGCANYRKTPGCRQTYNRSCVMQCGQRW